MEEDEKFEGRFTLRLYEPALIAEIAAQYARTKKKFRNKTDFLTYIIEHGLKANRELLKKGANRTTAAEAEESDIYALLLEIFKYMSNQFRKIYIDHNVAQGLLCSSYNMLCALNGDSSLFDKKIEQGYYDDLPERFESVIENLTKQYGIN